MKARVLFVLPTCLLLGAGAAAQTPAAQSGVPQSLTLGDAIDYAAAHYPSLRASIEQVNASEADVSVARGAYLPRLDTLWQSNRATANNIFGQVLPQSVIPSMSGPVLPAASGQSVWGSAVGALFSWEPFDFGLRQAGVAGAEADLGKARAGETLTRLDVESRVAAAFLDVVAAERAVAAAQADFDRRDVLSRAVQTLVDNQLRPGADRARAEAERAAALTRVILVRRADAIALATLLRGLGQTGGAIAVNADALIARMPTADVPAAAPVAVHPLAQVRQAEVEQARTRERVLADTDVPRVYLQSSVFARGSGASANGILDGGIDGLGLDRANWAAGVQVVFPNIFDLSTMRARKAAASASTRSQAALYDEALLAVTSGRQEAAASLEAARAVAANTPVQLAAAQQSEAQARARYNAGLASIVEVADAQSLLAQAEFQDQAARVDVWRALLAAAAAQGDLAPFVALTRQP